MSSTSEREPNRTQVGSAVVPKMAGADQPTSGGRARRLTRDIAEINHGLFQALLLVYLVLVLLEALRPGTVSRFLDLNYLLVLVVATGAVVAFTARRPQAVAARTFRRRDVFLAATLAITAWLLLWYKFQDVGWIQYPVSLLGGVLVGAISLKLLLPEASEQMTTPPDDPGHPKLIRSPTTRQATPAAFLGRREPPRIPSNPPPASPPPAKRGKRGTP